MTLDMRRVNATVQVFKQLGTRVPSTLSRALNQGVKSAQRLTREAVVQRVPLKEKNLLKALRIVPATPERLEARLRAFGLRVPLIAYLDIRGGLRSGQGIGGRAFALGTVPGRGFVAKMPSGHLGVYARTGMARLPIRELMGPNLQDLINRFGIYRQILPKVELEVKLAALKVGGLNA